MAKCTKSSQTRGRYGVSGALLDRRREVWSLRAQGLSYTAIASRLGIGRKTAHEDGQWCAREWGSLDENSRDAIQGQLIEIMRRATNLLMRDLENQAVNGQVTEAIAADGTVVGTQRKTWINSQVAAELGRTTERIAKLAGVLDSSIDATGGNVSNVQVVLPAPMNGPSFADATEKGTLGAASAVNTALDINAEGEESVPEPPQTLP